ncbi:MAG TPA: alpha/beta hydrolase [Chitinophagaceae bacterium]|nr:alpha/beta hydrolase [Chitinophagaceae bacterium]
MNKKTITGLIAVFIYSAVCAQVQYPYPSQQFPIHIENKDSYMSYMDVKPSTGNGETILLFHGKNFSGYYWKDLIPLLVKRGYRVIAPDLPGWGHSGKPNLHYSFHMLSTVNKSLLDSLHINKVIVLGHSMGGMLAVRFTLMYPELTGKLVLENPIGLEDYKTFVPYQTLQQLYTKEKSASYESYKKYRQTYYPVWKPAYEQYVAAQAEALSDPAFDDIAWVNAVTYQMIYEQPVVYELGRITVPVLLIIGQADRTVVGKDQLTDEQKGQYGQYPQLGRKAAGAIKNAKLIELEAMGHISHIQDLDKFVSALFSFL